MDQIQRILIKAGRKDLAQEYYQKTAVDWNAKVNKEDDKLHELNFNFWKTYKEILSTISKAKQYAEYTLEDIGQVDAVLQAARRPVLEKKIKEYKIFRERLKELNDKLLSWNLGVSILTKGSSVDKTGG